MTKHVVFFDLEIKKGPNEFGGWKNIHQAGMALGAGWDNISRKHFFFNEDEVSLLENKLCSADLVIGFNLLNFDYKVLQPYLSFDLFQLPTFDLMLSINSKNSLGYRVSLMHLIRHTLERECPSMGYECLEWFKQGQINKVIDHCAWEIDALRDFVQYGRQNGFVKYMDPPSHKIVRKLAVDWSHLPSCID